MPRKVQGPVVLVVLDGWGIREEREHNGIALADTPWYDHALETYPFTQLQASGEYVGLPNGQMGNSEVGHTTIGAGAVLYQDLVRIKKDIQSGEFAKNKAFQTAFQHVKTHRSTLHIIGLLSAGGVHSHQEHLFAVLSAAKENEVQSIVVHPFLDGRDSPKTSGTESLRQLEELTKRLGGVAIGSVIGRYFAMDRDTNWDRTNMAFDAIFNGKADHIYETSIRPSQIIEEWYRKDVFDELMEPMVFQTENGTVLEVHDNDAVLFVNFRKDRARQLTMKICEQAKDRNLCVVTMADYGKDIETLVAYTPEKIQATLAGVIADSGLHQAHLAETEKFPHATYFLNGGRQEPFPNEDDCVLPSRKDIVTHDQAPEMRAKEICAAAIDRLSKNDFLFINFANPDMVGHTANERAIITAIETVDTQMQKLTDAVLMQNGALLVIADHGNAETIVDPITGEPHTSHTTNPVPCFFIHKTYHPSLRHDDPSLRDVAPTILEVLGLSQPEPMTGSSLLQ